MDNFVALENLSEASGGPTVTKEYGYVKFYLITTSVFYSAILKT